MYLFSFYCVISLNLSTITEVMFLFNMHVACRSTYTFTTGVSQELVHKCANLYTYKILLYKFVQRHCTNLYTMCTYKFVHLCTVAIHSVIGIDCIIGTGVQICTLLLQCRRVIAL